MKKPTNPEPCLMENINFELNKHSSGNLKKKNQTKVGKA